MEDIIIIGCGPIGLYAAHLASLHNLKGLVLEARSQVGGQLTSLYPEKDIIDVPGFTKITAKGLIEKFYEQYSSRENKLPIHLEESVVNFEVIEGGYRLTTTHKVSYETKTVLIVSGMGNFTPRKAYFREILAGGTPSFTRQGMASVGVAMLNVAAGAFGDAAIAGMSIVSRVTFVIFATVIGLGQGFQPLCGFCYGAKLYARVREGYWFIVRLGTTFLVFCAVLGFLFSSGIIAIFRHDPAVIEVGRVALRWQLVTLPLGAVVMYTNMMMQTIRKPWQANILAASRNGLFFIPLIIILPHCFGLLGVEMCQAWADVLSFILSVPITVSGFKALRD